MHCQIIDCSFMVCHAQRPFYFWGYPMTSNPAEFEPLAMLKIEGTIIKNHVPSSNQTWFAIELSCIELDDFSHGCKFSGSDFPAMVDESGSVRPQIHQYHRILPSLSLSKQYLSYKIIINVTKPPCWLICWFYIT